jgi:RNA polymerase sigma factor (sigma-70 family)
MATSAMTEVIQRLRGTVFLRDGAGLSDGQLLEAYISRREKAALAALVRRHGPMVWGVCRRVLRNYHDAEDAFQAAFLVLVRKAASIASRELLGNWLYGVAYQTALKARATAAKRRGRERQVVQMPEPQAARQDLWHDLLPLLDQELTRLPDKYRIPIVLCDLEGKTRAEAARQLGCPEGTIAGRLARARVLLAKRLGRHGPAVSGGALAAVLAQGAAPASVPAPVVSSTIRAASLFAAGQAATTGAISGKAAALMEGVLKAMLFHKIKNVVALFLLIAGVGIGVNGLIQTTAAQDGPPSPTALPRQDEGNLKETVLALQKRIWEAHAKQDLSAMKNLYARDFAGLDKHGNPFDKGEVIRYVSEWCEFDHAIKEAKVLLLNDSSAIVIFEVHYKVRRTKSQDVSHVESRQGTGAWAKRNGQWWYVYHESHTVSAEKLRNLAGSVRWRFEEIYKAKKKPEAEGKDKEEGKRPEEELQLIRQAKTKLEEMNAALSKGDFGKIVDLTHPRLVEKDGGREKMIATMKAVMEDTKSKGFSLRSSTVGAATQFLRTAKALYVVFPTATEITYRVPPEIGLGGGTTSRSVVVGISENGGKTWAFVSNPAAVRKHLPDLLPETLRVPDVPNFSQLEPGRGF